MPVVLLIAALWAPAPALAQRENAWLACKQKTECVKVPVACGRMGAVNRRFEKESSKARAKMAELIACLEPTAEQREQDKRSEAFCEKGQCALSTPPAQTPKPSSP